ncbi:hypothetical protein [Kitasatospora purpeofusca]|uniref:hypothetical protein n=1 Tax=Kitasatospora purpeofusca TaxID=67352 RepID=UPI00386F9899|nr:hypothetical protein OIP63_24585 [Kitasatospora purpeofusca]
MLSSGSHIGHERLNVHVVTTEALALARPTGTPPANEFRIRVGQWMQSVPTGGPWKSLGSSFVLFLMHAAQKADADGTNLHCPPSNLWFSRACRVSKDSVPGFYRAAEAAGVMALVHGPSGVRVRGYAVTMPLGGVPDWDAALAVLRADARRVKQEQLRCDAGKSARAESVRSARAALPQPRCGEKKSARADSGRSAREGSKLRTCGFNQEVPYQVEKMVAVVVTGTTPRASEQPASPDPTGWERMTEHLPPDLQEPARAVPGDDLLRRVTAMAIGAGWASPGWLAARLASHRRPQAPDEPAPADRLAAGLVAVLGVLSDRHAQVGRGSYAPAHE